jgi:hypothetical protein
VVRGVGRAGVRSGRTATRRPDAGPASEPSALPKETPASAEETKITQLDDGSLQFEAKVPGRVPGSSATYTKIVAEDGTTVGHTKTTTLPDGSIAHVKDKMPK